MIEQFVFYLFSIALLASSVMVVSVRNPVFAALFLILAFFLSAGLWLLLTAEFLAVTLVLVYVGAVMVLFMFVVMMLDIDLSRLRSNFTRYLLFGSGIAVLMAALMVFVLKDVEFMAVVDIEQYRQAQRDNTSELGRVLYTDYLYPFEIAGGILLVAIVAAISLTMRQPRSSKKQRIEEQLAADRNRVRLVAMPGGEAGAEDAANSAPSDTRQSSGEHDR